MNLNKMRIKADGKEIGTFETLCINGEYPGVDVEFKPVGEENVDGGHKRVLFEHDPDKGFRIVIWDEDHEDPIYEHVFAH